MGLRKAAWLNEELDCGVTASFLDSGATIAQASNIAAVIACFEMVYANGTVCRILVAVSFLCWAIQCWLAVRVRIDASLFRLLSKDAETGASQLDETLLRWGFIHRIQKRSIADRSRGALRLWKRQLLTFGIQALTLLTSIGLSLYR